MSGVDYAKSIGVKVGDGCFISSKNYSSEPYLIEIGNYVRIANNVHFIRMEECGLKLKNYLKVHWNILEE